jgi:hypothetical protein
MKDPIKIIHKFKNNNKRIQYKVYIFVGSQVPSNIMKLLNFIVDKDLYTALNTLSKSEYETLENFYGDKWYEKMFTSYHINSMIKLINSNAQSAKKKSLETKYGKEWCRLNLEDIKVKKIAYSFSANYYNYLLLNNKIKTQTRKVEMDFRTHGISKNTIEVLQTIDDPTNIIVGGGDDDDTEPETTDDDSSDEEVINEDVLEEKIEEDVNLEDITKLYTTIDTDNNKMVQETSKLISEAINDTKWDKNVEKQLKKYDGSLDNLAYDSKLEEIYNKVYITDQYIYKDDTIKTMRSKITVAISLSEKYGKEIKLLPEAQYFWSEYNIDNKMDMVMLGQKWIRRNELLKIDIMPNENIKVYEKLRNNLSYLKESFGYKIKREDDETNIIRFYEDYITMNEIFMLDIYNELGLNYNPDLEEKRNIYDVYICIYYPMISYERLEQIVDLLGGKNIKELQFIESQFGTIRNDNKIETHIEDTIENAKMNLGKFNKNFADNHIIQSIIHVNINDPKNITGTTSNNKFNLYRIFDNFIVDEAYPFIQYQSFDSQLTYKFYTISEKIENQELLARWFENAPYGISFKIKLNNENSDKYLSINLHETGRLEYKITWKEEDMATSNNINETYTYVRNLLKKINSENKKIKFILPQDDKFKYAFINTIQKFTIPENFKIDHNDLSEFSRFFFPFVSLVIEPRKRKAAVEKEAKDETSKYGTYLRYKRISKYDNRTRMHLRILYFLRNYELSDKELIDEIAKQFNITQDVSAKELDFVREKYSKVIRKSSKITKTLKTMPKSKPPGIGIDIQGRDRDKYKIRITGARNKEQLEEIIDFMKVLIYLYVETYLYKKPEYQKLKDLLRTLTKIAKRRNKVMEVVEYDPNIKTVKSITGLDKARLGFKPEKGQNQWTRSCQNSGNDKKRRPDITSGDQLNKLLTEGYKLNNKTGYYEKNVEMKIRGKKYSTVIKAIKLADANETYNYYSCDPSQNQEHMYIGFLARGNNPSDLCMPCCFKKDQLTSGNKEKKKYFLKCIGEEKDKGKNDDTNMVNTNTMGDKIYILQETNKIQEGRFIYLSKYLDIFFNRMWNHDQKIKNHYLLESKSGYFFKYTVKHEYYFFLVAIANIFELSIDMIISKIVKFLEKDEDNRFFTYLNNGDIAESFKERKLFIEYIKNSNYLEYDLIGELIALPGVLSEKGINYYILDKKVTVIKKALEKEVTKERFYMECLNLENYYQYNYNKNIVILIKEDNYYFPIYKVQKDEKINKKIILQKHYINDTDKNNKNNKIINELKNYHNKSCNNTLINQISSNKNLIAKNIIEILKKNNRTIVKQYIDDRNKCKYIECDNKLLLPVIPSGISYEYSFKKIAENKSPIDLKTTIKLLEDINTILKLDYVPRTVFYDKKTKNMINIISLLLDNNLSIPIKNEMVDIDSIKNMALSIRFQPLEESIDMEIIKYDNTVIYDERSQSVKEHNYKTESYNLYRLELSLYLSNNIETKDKIISIVKNQSMKLKDKKHELRKILFDIIDKKLSSQYKLSVSKGGATNNGGATDSNDMNGGAIVQAENMATIVNELPNLKDYVINNVRDYCEINNKDKCTNNKNLHCIWKDNKCKLLLLESLAIDFVNKVIEEMIQDGIKFKELIQETTYYVSDIVDYSQYTFRNDQKIIKATNFNISKLMSELFGKDKIPTIGKRQIKNINMNKQDIEEDFQELLELGKQYIQEIIPNKDSIIRAYINSYYWINNPLYDVESRNLKYTSTLQTSLTYLFKANIIDFIQNNINDDKNIKSYIEKYFKNNDNFFESSLNKFRKTSFNTDGKVELFILSHLIDIPIVVYDNYSTVKYIFLQGEIKVTEETIKQFTSETNLNRTIFLKFNFDNSKTIPKNIYSIYYI